jgi:hypothetical protein
LTVESLPGATGMRNQWRSFDDLAVRNWLEQHSGVFSEVAVMFACNPRFVQQVAYGKDRAPHSKLRLAIEQELRVKGWPGHKRLRS